MGKRKRRHPLEELVFSAFEVRVVPIGDVSVDPGFQPRLRPPTDADSWFVELKESIKLQGIRDPIKVLPREDGYTVLGGNCRYQAAKELGLREVPVLLCEGLSEAQACVLSLEDNLHRKSIGPISMTRYLARMKNDLGFTQNELADITSLSTGTVSTYLRLLKLPEEVLQSVEDGDLRYSKAGALVALVREDVPAHVVLRLAQKARNTSVSQKMLEKIGGLFDQGPDKRSRYDQLPRLLQNAILDKPNVGIEHAEAYLDTNGFVGRWNLRPPERSDEGLMRELAERLSKTLLGDLPTVAGWFAKGETRQTGPRTPAERLLTATEDMTEEAERLKPFRISRHDYTPEEYRELRTKLRTLSACVRNWRTMLGDPDGSAKNRPGRVPQLATPASAAAGSQPGATRQTKDVI